MKQGIPVGEELKILSLIKKLAIVNRDAKNFGFEFLSIQLS
jgi:hypothetical protein